MGFFEYELGRLGGISKDYFKNHALNALSDLFDVDPKYVGINGARYYSRFYAEARLQEARQQITLYSSKSYKEKWLSELERWHKAILHFNSGNLTFLSQELDKDKEKFLSSPKEDDKTRSLGRVLGMLSAKLEENLDQSILT